MFVMVSPLETHLKETLTSLRFATKVRLRTTHNFSPSARSHGTGSQHTYRHGQGDEEDQGRRLVGDATQGPKAMGKEKLVMMRAYTITTKEARKVTCGDHYGKVLEISECCFSMEFLVYSYDK
jgi:hypothetical protein